MDRSNDVASLSEFPKPRPFRGWPGRKTGAAGLVRILVASLIEAGQGAVRGARQQPAVPQEGFGLLQGLERPVGRQPALELSPLSPLGQPLHDSIWPAPA